MTKVQVVVRGSYISIAGKIQSGNSPIAKHLTWGAKDIVVHILDGITAIMQPSAIASFQLPRTPQPTSLRASLRNSRLLIGFASLRQIHRLFEPEALFSIERRY